MSIPDVADALLLLLSQRAEQGSADVREVIAAFAGHVDLETAQAAATAFIERRWLTLEGDHLRITAVGRDLSRLRSRDRMRVVRDVIAKASPEGVTFLPTVRPVKDD